MKLLFILSLAAGLAFEATSGKKVVMCYFGSWSVYRWSYGLFDVENIDPFLCTHLVYGFAGLNKDTYTIEALDKFNDLEEEWGKGAYNRFTGLKGQNPDLKVLLAIGGWNEGCAAYSEMVASSSLRQTFIESVLIFFAGFRPA